MLWSIWWFILFWLRIPSWIFLKLPYIYLGFFGTVDASEISHERKCWYLAWASHLKFNPQPDQKLLPVKRKLLWGYFCSLYYIRKKKKTKPKTKSEDHSASGTSMESLSIFGTLVLFKSLTNSEPKVRTLVLLQWLQQHCVYAGISSSLSWPPAPSPSCCELLVYHSLPKN